jgi:hypothetical protein
MNDYMDGYDGIKNKLNEKVDDSFWVKPRRVPPKRFKYKPKRKRKTKKSKIGNKNIPSDAGFKKKAKRSKGIRSDLARMRREQRKAMRKNKKKKQQDPFAVEIFTKDDFTGEKFVIETVVESGASKRE